MFRIIADFLYLRLFFFPLDFTFFSFQFSFMGYRYCHLYVTQNHLLSLTLRVTGFLILTIYVYSFCFQHPFMGLNFPFQMTLTLVSFILPAVKTKTKLVLNQAKKWCMNEGQIQESIAKKVPFQQNWHTNCTISSSNFKK